MNIIELVKSVLQEFPKINEVCNDIHVDFTDEIPTNYGLSPTGDKLVKESITGTQIREHNFVLYAIYQSQSDYDRLANSGVLLELQMWLEKHSDNQELSVMIGENNIVGTLLRLTCANGMLYQIPSNNMNDGVCYQLQITAKYKIEREEI
jgi:hypothetical protein